ncbi:MAG TPA: vitamin K epoxide reductase family protein [Terriglobales bacterium]|nr:vitamin K epoxide reductase family protein [Terriglobales bacterium]
MKVLTAALVVLCLAGVVVSTLALREHYNTEPAPCSINERWDCGVVNHSMFAVVRGVPVAAIGILGYALLAALAGRFRLLTALGALAGLAFALRLSYVEWKVLETWCIYCVASQGIIALILILAAVAFFLGRRTSARG